MKIIRHSIFYAFTIIMVFGCTGNIDNNTNSDEAMESNAVKETPGHQAGTVMLIVKARTELSEEEFLRVAKEREPQFQAIPGLIQKYYIKTNTPGEYGGVYIWDSMESLQKYRESELAATIGQAYKTIEPPSTEIVDIMFELRE